MNIRFRHLLVLIVMATSFVSCFKDDTTLGTGAISEIIIDSTSIQEVYNIAQYDTLVIKPRITQTNKEKEVTYSWEIELEEYSDSTIFVYVGQTLGTFHCRLVVENEDGKSFFPFILYVNTAYEEGLTIISKDTNGKAMLSFMLTPSDGSAPTGFMVGDQFSKVNEEAFADNPADIVQSSGSLIIACQGSDDGKSPATIYSLNEKTLVLENMVTAPEFPDFKPTILCIPGIDNQGSSYVVICEGGNTYEYSTSEGVISEAAKLPYTYAQTAALHTEERGYYDLLCWDNELNAVCYIYSGWGPYYSCEYRSPRDSIVADKTKNIFNGQSICKMVLIEQPRNVFTMPNVLVVTKNKRNKLKKAIIPVILWKSSEDKMEGTWDVECGSATNVTFTETTPCVANSLYPGMLFADGNKVRHWDYTGSDLIDKAGVFQTIGSESAIITSMSLSPDLKRTYIAFYEPEQSGLNGSVWIISTDTGKILETYNNVCYQPVKVMYKKK